MKKIYLILLICIAFLGTKAATFTVNISGFAYTPSVTTCAVGDFIVIVSSGFHPSNQVSQSTWLANGSTTLAGGWGSQTTTHTVTAVSTGTIYFVCQNYD